MTSAVSMKRGVVVYKKRETSEMVVSVRGSRVKRSCFNCSSLFYLFGLTLYHLSTSRK